jgi:hypothetical protein
VATHVGLAGSTSADSDGVVPRGVGIASSSGSSSSSATGSPRSGTTTAVHTVPAGIGSSSSSFGVGWDMMGAAVGLQVGSSTPAAAAAARRSPLATPAAAAGVAKGSTAAAEPDVPSHFRCPLSRVVMSDPVMAPDGHTYERAAIEDWLAVHGCSPVVRGQRMAVADLVPNNTMRVMLALYR